LAPWRVGGSHLRRVIAVAAMSQNRVIGANGKIPWHLPEDFRWFKQLTTGHFVLMGRKTFESIGKPLPNRTNIVITRRPRKLAKDPLFAPALVGNWRPRLGRSFQLGLSQMTERDVWLVRDLRKLVSAYEQVQPQRKLFVAGGANIYAQLLPRCTELYLTQVFREVDGDAHFPELDAGWTLVDVPLRTAEFEVGHFRRVLGA
jgi:dihydrofolate reductase